jgi:hypothetical protein
VIDAAGVEAAGQPFDAVHLIALLKEEPRQAEPTWPVMPVIKAIFIRAGKTTRSNY